MSQNEDIESMKAFKEIPISRDKRASIRKRNGLRVMVKDSNIGYVFGEIDYIGDNKDFYYMKRDAKKPVKLSYSHLERIFINGQKD